MKARFLFLCVWLAVAGPAWAQFRDPAAEFTRTNPKFLAGFREATARSAVSTVRVLGDGKDISLGVIVGADGWILTKANDLQGKITVAFRSGKVYDAEVVGVHTPHDLALLKIDAKGLIPVEFQDSKVVDVGNWIACVGLTDEPVAVGVISVATRNIVNKGPAIDLSKAPYLGVSLEPAEGGGVKITDVRPDTPASKLELKVGDIILSLAGTQVDQPEAFIQMLAKNRPGDTVILRIRRGKDERDMPAKLMARPANASRGDTQNKMGSDLSTRRSGYATILQHDSVVKPADCGGPIVDLDGRVVGINICRAGRVESWAVPSEVIRPILLELMSGKLAPKAGEYGVPRLSPDEKLAQAKAAVLKAERDKTRFEKDIDAARRALKSAEEEVKQYRRVQATEAAEAIVQNMQRRLMLMNDVAGWKWNHRQEIVDAVREHESLGRLRERGKELGIDPKVVDRFFQAQFEAAKLLQQDRIADWQKHNALAFVAGDLNKDLRPQIDKINNELLENLARMMPYWADKELSLPDRVRQDAQRVIAGQGINATVRAAALRGLLES